MHYLSFHGKKNRILELKQKIKSKFLFFNKYIKKALEFLIQETIITKQEHSKILESMDLPQDVDLSKLGNFYQKEYKKYRYILSFKKKAEPEKKQMPYPSTLLKLNNFQNRDQKIKLAIEFFKKTHVN